MKKTIEDIDVQGKKVLVRVDFNVPLNENGEITDETRIGAALPTIQYLLDHGAKVILMSHLGRPKGEVKPEFSLAPVAKRLGELLNTKVIFAKDCIGKEAQDAVDSMEAGQVVLLENLRFHKEETANDPEFAKKVEFNLTGAVPGQNRMFAQAKADNAVIHGVTTVIDADGNASVTCGGMTRTSGSKQNSTTLNAEKKQKERLEKKREERKNLRRKGS